MEIYRGYDLEPKHHGWQIYLDGKPVCWQPSLEFAHAWVNFEKNKQAERNESNVSPAH